MSVKNHHFIQMKSIWIKPYFINGSIAVKQPIDTPMHNIGVLLVKFIQCCIINFSMRDFLPFVIYHYICSYKKSIAHSYIIYLGYFQRKCNFLFVLAQVRFSIVSIAYVCCFIIKIFLLYYYLFKKIIVWWKCTIYELWSIIIRNDCVLIIK